MRVAPVACSASILPRLASSTPSENILPMKPIEWNAIASAPASGPGPNMATKNSAQINVEIERVATRINLAIRFTQRNGVAFFAARKPTGMPIIKPRIVAMAAMCIVSTKAGQTTGQKCAQSIGHMRLPMSTTCSGASYKNSGMISMVFSAQPIAAAIAKNTAKRANRWAGVKRIQRLSSAVADAGSAPTWALTGTPASHKFAALHRSLPGR